MTKFLQEFEVEDKFGGPDHPCFVSTEVGVVTSFSIDQLAGRESKTGEFPE